MALNSNDSMGILLKEEIGDRGNRGRGNRGQGNRGQTEVTPIVFVKIERELGQEINGVTSVCPYFSLARIVTIGL